MTNRTRRLPSLLVAMLLAATLLGPGSARSEQPAIYTDILPGVALGGYDPVAYFTEGAAIAGSEDFTVEWEGVEWRFSSGQNRTRFAADPEAYAPQFGGYCAWAVAEGYTAHGDPEVWTIVDRRLYLNYNQRIQRRWEGDVPGNIARGVAHWPAVLER